MVKKKGEWLESSKYRFSFHRFLFVCLFLSVMYFFLPSFSYLLITDILWCFPKHLENTMKQIQKPLATNRLYDAEGGMGHRDKW